MHSTVKSMISTPQQFQSSMQKIQLNSSQCLFAREKTFLMQSWLGFHNSCFFNFMCILLLSLSRSFCSCRFFSTYAFIVCVHRSFHSWQVFLILFKPIGTTAHYSVYVVNRYRGSIDILDSLPYSNNGTSRTSFHGDCQNIVSVS